MNSSKSAAQAGVGHKADLLLGFIFHSLYEKGTQQKLVTVFPFRAESRDFANVEVDILDLAK